MNPEETLAQWFFDEVIDCHETRSDRQDMANKCAAECIRQMEWARQDAGIEFEPGTNEVAPLTLAPPGWKP